MTRAFSICASLPAMLLAGACGRPADPEPDPVELELALAAIEARETGRAAEFHKKIAKADRVSATLVKVEPEKLDPNVATFFLR